MADIKTTSKPTSAPDPKAAVRGGPNDPANQPGNTGNAPTLSAGVKKTPTPEEDKAAKEQAAETNDKIEDALGGGYRRAAQIEAQAIRDGASVLGKEAVVVQNDQGEPIVGRRGMPSTEQTQASATNPSLMSNDAVIAGTPEEEEAAAEAKKRAAKDEKLGREPDAGPMVVTDLHGKGSQPHAG